MSSRFLVGLAAWLVGAAAATTGSMIAVDQLAHGLLGPQTQQLGSYTVDPDLDAGTTTALPSPSASTARAARKAPARSARRSARSAASPALSTPGTLLESPDGSVMAACGKGGAYLLYWSPDQGFWADDVRRGPASSASVTFVGSASSIVVQVSCSGTTPVARIRRSGGDDGSGGDD